MGTHPGGMPARSAGIPPGCEICFLDIPVVRLSATLLFIHNFSGFRSEGEPSGGEVEHSS